MLKPQRSNSKDRAVKKVYGEKKRSCYTGSTTPNSFLTIGKHLSGPSKEYRTEFNSLDGEEFSICNQSGVGVPIQITMKVDPQSTGATKHAKSKIYSPINEKPKPMKTGAKIYSPERKEVLAIHVDKHNNRYSQPVSLERQGYQTQKHSAKNSAANSKRQSMQIDMVETRRKS